MLEAVVFTVGSISEILEDGEARIEKSGKV